MADTIVDVIRLFVTEGAFLGGSKKGQAGVTTDTKRWLVHNITDDTIHVGISDDSLQMLISRNENIIGAKTFVPGLFIQNSTSGAEIVPEGDELVLRLKDFTTLRDIALETDSGTIIMRPNGIDTMFLTAVGTTFTKMVALVASTASDASLRILTGVKPTNAANGEMWMTSTGLGFQVNSVFAEWHQGTGSPEGVISASPGSFYSNFSGGAGTTFYVKESGTGNTGWIGK